MESYKRKSIKATIITFSILVTTTFLAVNFTNEFVLAMIALLVIAAIYFVYCMFEDYYFTEYVWSKDDD